MAFLLQTVGCDPTRKWVTATWFSKLLGQSIKPNTMNKVMAFDLGIRRIDVQGRPLGQHFGDFLILEGAASLLCADAQRGARVAFGCHCQIHNPRKPQPPGEDHNSREEEPKT